MSAQRRFVYDRWGNRTSVYDATSGGNQIQSVSLEQSGGVPTNRITSVTSGSTLNYSYDSAGNVTSDGVHSYTYDAENRVVSVDGGSTATYSYDHQNRRVKKVVGSTTTHYVWEGGQVIAEHNGSTGAMLNEYIYAKGRMIAREGGSGRVFFLYDRLSARATITDGQGNIQGRQSHLPFGEELNATGTTDKHRFTSYERDSETGMDYAVNRTNSPSIGRFLQVDKIYGDGSPQRLNRYAYTRNDPINRTDPLGLNDCPEGFVWNGKECVYDRGDTDGGTISGGFSDDDWFDDTFGDWSRGAPLIDGGFGMIPGPSGDSVAPPNPYADLNPCEKSLAWLNTPVHHFPGIYLARGIAEKYEADNGGPQDDNRVNAVKHCIWSCEMTQRTSYKTAEKWGTAHECDENGNQMSEGSDTKKAASSRMDLHNNEVGRFYGERFPKLDCRTQCEVDVFARLQTSPRR